MKQRVYHSIRLYVTHQWVRVLGCVLMLFCCSCQDADMNQPLSLSSPCEQFESAIREVFARDDAKTLARWMSTKNGTDIPQILPMSHESLWMLAVGYKAEDCIQLLLSVQPFEHPCTTYSVLECIAYLDKKELRVALLEMLKENIFVQQMNIEKGVPIYYTFWEEYTGFKKDAWKKKLGECRYNEYLKELREARENRLKEIQSAWEKELVK